MPGATTFDEDPTNPEITLKLGTLIFGDRLAIEALREQKGSMIMEPSFTVNGMSISKIEALAVAEFIKVIVGEG